MTFEQSSKFDLEPYLRLNHASEPELQIALRRLLPDQAIDLRCGVRRENASAGALSALWSPAGVVVCLTLATEAELVAAAMPAWCQIRAGCAEVRSPTGRLSLSERTGCRLTGDTWSVSVAPATRLVLLWPTGAKQLPIQPEDRVACLLECFLFQTRFIGSHAKAIAGATRLLSSLVDGVAGSRCEQPPALDRRLQRAIEKIEQEPDWAFDLAELARHSGVSERNLYYLMKRETGMTPYRWYQRCRLIRVRRRLVDCHCEEPHISRYAADEGFSHLGRFAALYRQHFGELPRETIQWRRTLLSSNAVDADRALAVS